MALVEKLFGTAAHLDIPAKISMPEFAVARLIHAGDWDMVREACEGDVIRILRGVIELGEGRGYVSALQARRAAAFSKQIASACADATVFSPWHGRQAA